MADYRALARQKAKKYGLDPELFARQIGAESGFNPRAVSPAGARGIAQIMPATARGWGVNPDDPDAALDAAAKNMAKYVQQYGNWRDALTAYNAGPGAVGKPLYRETRAYISKILGGTNPTASKSHAPAREPAAPAETGGGVDKNAALVDSLLARKAKFGDGKLGSGLLQDAQQRIASGAYGTPAQAKQRAPQGSSRPAPRAEKASGSGELLELFWQGPGGINAKDGKRVAQGFVSGHTEHVHVAASTPAAVVALGRIAQSMGLHVGEQPAFGKVNRVHVANSNHYSNRAIDVSGDPAKMRAFAHRVAQMYGV